MASIPERIGLDTQMRGFLLTTAIPLDDEIHRLDNNLRLLYASGEEIHATETEYYPGDEIGKVVDDIIKFKGNDKLVVINPNGVWETKRWTIKQFTKLASLITDKIVARVVVIGALDDEERGIQVARDNKKILDVTGRTSVDDLYRIMKISNLVITNDSGPMHIAAAANARLIAIFGPTDPRRCGPRCENPLILTGEAKCLGCYKKTCDDFICMKTLSIERVFEEANRILKS
jgi:ADP-heptose:LPS heptosyltransferase